MVKELSLIEFGKGLLQTNDLDPVYVLLWESGLCRPERRKHLQKWLLAYWCFYHIGTASWIADAEDYWVAFKTAVGSKAWPRSSERRHFRGDNAAKSVSYLQSQGIDNLFNPLLKTTRLQEVKDTVSNWVGFGPWISFKIADMLERLALVNIQFPRDEVFLYASPRKGAEEAFRRYGNGATTSVGQWATSYYLSRQGDTPAPPRYERTIGVQEVETILCKWKSHLHGHYELGEDLVACKKSLLRFIYTPTARQMFQCGEEAKLWQ